MRHALVVPQIHDMAKLGELAKEFGYWPASTDEESVERPVDIIIVRAVTRHHAEGLEYHALPTDDPPACVKYSA